MKRKNTDLVDALQATTIHTNLMDTVQKCNLESQRIICSSIFQNTKLFQIDLPLLHSSSFLNS